MNLDEQIADLNPADEVASTLRAMYARRPVEANREAGYISVRPVERHIAAYFNRAFIDVAVEPDRSGSLAARHPGTSVLQKTRATHYLRIPAGAVDTEAILELIDGALDWRERGHRWLGDRTAGGSADLAGETCAKCNYEIANNGSCGCD